MRVRVKDLSSSEVSFYYMPLYDGQIFTTGKFDGHSHVHS